MQVARLLALTALCAGSLACHADSLVFDLSPTNGTTLRSASSGPGQGVVVSTTTTIDDFAFYINLPNGGDVRYLIFNGSNTSLLYSQTIAVAGSSTPAWVEATPFSFTLNAGSTYYFGLIADNDLDVGYIFPSSPYSSNGLTAVDGANSNYVNFANPTVSLPGVADIGLRIYATSATPEPSSLLLLGTGVAAMAGVLRRRYA